MYQPTRTACALDNPDLLERYIIAQYIDALRPATRANFAPEDRSEARKLLLRLASLRHETPRDTLQGILHT